jgi:starvation-inducible DNA-binding protein
MKKKAQHKDNSDLVKKLNALLASYQVAYFNTRSSHWMIKGENFFELHKVFETAYNDATVKIDEIAERILTLGGKPFLTASDMLKTSSIKEYGVNGDQAKCVAGLLEDLKSLGVIENEIVKIAQDQQDVVTADMITKYLGEQQKTSWMLYQFLDRRSSITK